ncbi:MAG: hypothetical protein O2855_07590 [Planctomycetota bacterium]|nr:hypothetical protein [Planctomycetota bacterium]
MRHSLTVIVAACAITLPATNLLAQQDGAEGRQRDRGEGQGRGQGPGQGQGQGQGSRGQRGARGMGAFTQYRQQYEPEFLTRDVRLFHDQLALDDAQTTIIETLVSDYEEAFTPAAEEAREISQEAMRELFRSFMGGMDQQVIGETFQKIQEEVRQLEQEAGGEIDPDVRRRLMQERFEKLGQEMQAQRMANGGVAEAREILNEMFETSREFGAKRTELRAQLVESAKAILNAEQSARWDAFERFLRRERAMGNGSLSGESTNMLFVVDESGISQASIDGLRELLDNYELDLDARLVARDNFIRDSEGKLMKALVDGNNNAAEQVIKRQLELRRSVRDCNDSYRAQLAAALQHDEAVRVTDAANEAGFRRVYQKSGTQRAFEAALELNLDEGVRLQVQELQTVYLAEMGTINDRIATQTRTVEPAEQLTQATDFFKLIDGSGSPTEMFSRGRGGRGGGFGSTDETLTKLSDERTERNDSYRDRLEALLTPEQVEELPGRGRGGQRGAQGGQGGQGGGFGGNFSGRIDELPERMQERAKEFDKNNDGTLDEAEREQMFQSFRGGQGQRGGGNQTPDA